MGPDGGDGGDIGGVGAGAGDGEPSAPEVDTSVAHPARIYDYWLGGQDNFAADREAGELALRAYPELAQAVQSNRAFLARAVRYLTGEAGIRQFLDIGTGIPAASNTHEVAQQAAPDTKIVYVDNDHCKSGCAHAGITVTVVPSSRPRRQLTTCRVGQNARSVPRAVLALRPQCREQAWSLLSVGLRVRSASALASARPPGA
ncbi:MAG: SAM-dependent methyltransferase [Streptosporangiaceae bacterium]